MLITITYPKFEFGQKMRQRNLGVKTIHTASDLFGHIG